MYIIIVQHSYPQRIAFQLLAEMKLELEEKFANEIAISMRRFCLHPMADLCISSVCAK
jgi:hypothetical protein